MTDSKTPLKVLIAGGGIAGLEAALALRDLAGDLVATTLLAPHPDFVYRPLRVREPFAGPAARHYPLNVFAHDAGVELRRDAFKWLAPSERTVHTQAGEQLSYDALLLAMGARLEARFRHAITLDDRTFDEQLHGLIQDIEAGYVHRLAFVAPDAMAWPLPLYELALMTARRAYEMNEDASVTIVTPEDAPLAVFGDDATRAVQALLDDARIRFVSSDQVQTPSPGQVILHPNGERLAVDRIVALPQLVGPATPGVPKHAAHGFISVDRAFRVHGLPDVFAAGDATDYPVKHGGVAAQQADIAAAGIARLAGAQVEMPAWKPELRAVLIGGSEPLRLSAHITGRHGSCSVAARDREWSPRTKVAARYLGPYLEARDRAEAAVSASASDHPRPRTQTRQ